MPDETPPLRDRLAAAVRDSRVVPAAADPTDPDAHDYGDEPDTDDTDANDANDGADDADSEDTTMPTEVITITITDNDGTELESVTLNVDSAVDLTVTADGSEDGTGDGDSGN